MRARVGSVAALLVVITAACARRSEVGPDPALARPPLPIISGTLAVTRDGRYAVAANPDRDTVAVVDLARGVVAFTVTLPPRSEPGRIVEDGLGHAVVALRNAGALATIDLHEETYSTRPAGCAAPRGLAYDPRARVILVACSSGALVSLPERGGDPVRSVHVRDDLRDVVLDGSRLYVTTFRTAALLELGDDGSVAFDHSPFAIARAGLHASSPAVAWRAQAGPGGGVFVLHQRDSDEQLAVPEGRASAPPAGTYGGAGDSCRTPGAVQTVFSYTWGDGTATVRLGSVVLGVDVAFRRDGGAFAVAGPGEARRSGRQVLVYSEDVVRNGSECVTSPLRTFTADGPVTALAYAPDGTLLALTQQPSRLHRYGPDGRDRVVRLADGPRTEDRGHVLFHSNPGGGIACASCHPEGGDDGHVWRFSDGSVRRTQSLRGGISGTFPLHWDGSFATMEELVADTLVRRMGGHMPDVPDTEALERWIDSIPVVPVPAPEDTAAVERGRALFTDARVGCASCHSGGRYTNNATVDVGTGEALQVPSLTGLAARAPYMHTGCARTLRERFDPACGGASHGDVSGLSPAQLDDMVAYLRTL